MAKTPICNSQIFFWKVIVTGYTEYFKVQVLQCTAKYWALLGYTGEEVVQGGTVATPGHWSYCGVQGVTRGTGE